MKLLTLLFTLLSVMPIQAVTYSREDSLRIVKLLKQGGGVLDYAERLIGIPYVGATLEVNPKEELAVNLHQLDCTTFVETCLALALTSKQGSTAFGDYCKNLTRIRYREGKLNEYPSRNHYFTQWISSNEKLGLVKEITATKAPFSASRKIDLHYMSQHPDYYPMLKGDKKALQQIRQYEKESSGRTVRYIPRAELNQKKNSPLGCIKDGDILAIVTKKDGLDVSHIGFAKWGKDGKLHLLNASQIHKKVVLEPMTLYEYMGKHPSQLGIRVIRPR